MQNSNVDLTFANQKKEPYLYAVDVFETETSRARYKVE